MISRLKPTFDACDTVIKAYTSVITTCTTETRTNLLGDSQVLATVLVVLELDAFWNSER